MVFDNVNFHDSWWQKLGIPYNTENVYGKAINSSPDPKFVTENGDGFVSSDELPNFVGLLWTEFMSLFKKDSI